ncbi:hypothetical protein XA68_17554 [Ophiocordyceps unilateralis]|uniref:EngB-type G domain-containing protein n=1 Tax=Ophiocordyceps unilateralis TaxID=268505 RepID=A0A2A9PKN4_OPHUN|nr:hypothetical protein XA68_17554 [Ophiocordyceps unilateralis]
MIPASRKPPRRAIRKLFRLIYASPFSVSALRSGIRPSPICLRGHHSFDADSTPPHTSKCSALNYSRRPAMDRSPSYQQSLKGCKIIQQMPDGVLTTEVFKKQARKMYSAREFFQQGCSYLYSAAKYGQHPVNQHVPEILVTGASNVGKSTFVNALLCRAGASRVSRLPGKTTLMHAFGVGFRPTIAPKLVQKGLPPPQHSLTIVDTPGYGHRSLESWGQGILEYMEKRPTFQGAVLLLSSDKEKPTAEDQWMLEMLADRKVKVIVVLTKADKYRFTWQSRCRDLAKAVSVGLRSEDCAVYVVSAAIDVPAKIGNAGGMGGVRAAIMDMAGFQLWRNTFVLNPNKVAYGGPVVPFEEMQPT